MSTGSETQPTDDGKKDGQEPPATIEDIDLDVKITKDTFDPEKFETLKARLREEAKNGTKAQQDKLREYEAKIAEFEKAGLSEKEKLERERDEAKAAADEAKAALRERDTRDKLEAIASDLKFRNPKLAYSLVNAKDLELDDKGNVTNGADLLKKVAKSDPYLLAGGASADGGERGEGDPKNNDINSMLRQAAGRKRQG